RVQQPRGLLVETVRTDRLAQQRVAVRMTAVTARRAAMRASRGGMAGAAGAALAVADPLGVDRSETGSGEGDEQPGMRRNGGREALAAGQPGPDQLVGVGTVDLGTGRATQH